MSYGCSDGAGTTRPTGNHVVREIELELKYSGFSSPVYLTSAGDGSGRIFVVEQAGRIMLIKNDEVQQTPFLDINSKVLSGGERGLLSVAFSPNFKKDDRFYVNYTRSGDGASVIARYSVDSNDEDTALVDSENILLTVNQPYSNHNGGMMAFGRDGYLYIGFGDGGSAGDPQGNGQNTNTLLGKIIRIAPEVGAGTYEIPGDNPFFGKQGYREEIWALGLRNPWRFSFDRYTGDLYTADVGQSSWEEINVQPASSPGGENYGWKIMEGAHCFGASTCDQTDLTLPVYEYDHKEGCSVTGGYVYRGSKYAEFWGVYFFGDYCRGKIWGLQRVGGEWQAELLLDAGFRIASFGESEDGELYVVALPGDIYKIRRAVPD